MQLTALLSRKAKSDDDAAGTSHEEDTSTFDIKKNVAISTDMRYLQADKIKLCHKRLPRCIFGASEIDMTKRNQ